MVDCSISKSSMKKGTKGLLALDIDGTLVPKGHEALSSSTLQHLHDLYEKGWEILFATGRTLKWARKCLGEMRCPYTVSLLNGALVKSMPSEKVLFESFLPLPTLQIMEKKLREEFGPSGCTICSLEGDSVFIIKDRFSSIMFDHIRFRQKKLQEVWHEAEDVHHVPLEKSGGMLLFFDNEGKACDVSQWFENTFSVHAPVMKDAFNPDIFLVLVTAKDANKGKAVSLCASLFSFAKHQIVAVGDDSNDLTMFQHADLSISFSHSPKHVQEASDLVVNSTTEHIVPFFPYIQAL